ncbi:MAG: hypothetical protein K1Y36_24480 [Blastocatellia bacterium]|nr:hypothetical protein [Blastocatellia bacterium]
MDLAETPRGSKGFTRFHFGFIFGFLVFLAACGIVLPTLGIALAQVYESLWGKPTPEEQSRMLAFAFSVPTTLSWALCLGFAVTSLVRYNVRRDKFTMWKMVKELEELELARNRRVPELEIEGGASGRLFNRAADPKSRKQELR